MERYLFWFIMWFIWIILYKWVNDIIKLNTQWWDNVIILIIMSFYICIVLLLAKEFFN